MNEFAETVTSPTAWLRARDRYELLADEVHVWRANLEQPQSCWASLIRVLSAEERERAGRYHFEADRKRCIIGRGLTRLLLAHCLRESPERLRFVYNAFGKSALASERLAHLQFNVSHSGDWILVALSRGRQLGVDVERHRSDMASDAIAARFFSPSECSVLAGLPPEMRCTAFFSCWTRKEAYLKARGDGLSLALDQFDVAFAPGAEPRLIATWHDPVDAERWTLADLQVGSDYAGAIAVQGANWQLKCWDWPPAGRLFGTI
jgi:4'-phosphopantetheinyl transferase